MKRQLKLPFFGPSKIVVGYLIAFSLLLLLFSNSILSSLSSSMLLSNVSAQSDRQGSNQGNLGDERLSQALDNTKKLRQVAGERIPNHYIVVLKDRITTTMSPSSSGLSSSSSSSSSSPTTADSVRASAEKARSEGAVLRHLYEHALKGYAIRVPNDQVLQSILKNPEVDYVQPDMRVKKFSQTLPTGIDRVDGDLSSTKSGDGSGTVDADIAILDTGIQLNHPDLNVVNHVECITTSQCITGTGAGDDDDGHGTSVAGIAAAKDDSNGVVGIAPGARLWAVKVLDSNGYGFDSDIIAGIDYITQHANEIDTVNMSFGGDGPDEALHTAIINSVNAGVTYTAAAGNEAADAGSVVPASFPEVIAVSAIVDTDGKCGGVSSISTSAGKDDTFASFSNYGSVVDIAAPGVLVRTTANGGSYTSFSGTSASTPHVTGAAALYKSTHSGATPSDIRNALRSSGTTSGTVCDGKGHGYFTGDRDNIAEPLLYLASSTSLDSTPPIVVSTSPTDGATGFAVTSSITASFSEAVQSSTVTTSTFTLKNSAGTSIAGTVTLSGNVATFKPSSSLAFSTSYTAAVTNGIKDLAGNSLTPKSWSFTTAAQADTTPPTVTSTTPTDGATGFAVTSSITASFSEAVQSSTVTTSTFTLKNSAGTSIAGTVTLSGNVATFKPSSSLAFSTSYTAAVTNGIKDLAGNSLTPKSWSFTTAAAPPPPPPPDSSCDNNLAISTATSSGSQSTFVPTNAIDNNLNTKWWSTFIVDPWIRVDLGSQHAICSVSIAWADGTTRQYSFTISVSTDGSSFSNVFSGKSSGTSASPQKYSFAESQARFVKITITLSHAGSSTSIAQISEVDVFGKTGTSSLSSSSSSASFSQAETELKSKSNSKQSLANNEASETTNHPPIAKADKITTNKNSQILIAVMSNDVDPDGDKLSVISASSNSKNGGTIQINNNGSITFIPSVNFVGQDTFSYSISDGKGKSDKAKVSVIVKSISVDQLGKKDKRTLAIENQQNSLQGQNEKSQLTNQFNDNNNQQLDELSLESTPNSNNDTATSN